GKCVQGALDSVENTADIAAHQRQSADREDGNEAEDNAVLDHTLAFFFANQIHEELHELLTFPDREVEVEPVVSLRVPAKARFRNSEGCWRVSPAEASAGQPPGRVSRRVSWSSAAPDVQRNREGMPLR